MPSKNVEYLQEHGPATYDELPNDHVTPSDRRNGVWKFSVKTKYNPHSKPTGGNVNTVYYLAGEHDQEAVLERFIEVNRSLIDAKPRKIVRKMLRRQGRQWHDAVDAVFPKHPEASHAE